MFYTIFVTYVSICSKQIYATAVCRLQVLSRPTDAQFRCLVNGQADGFDVLTTPDPFVQIRST